MKYVRILAIVALALVSLFNVGYPFGTEPKPGLPLAIAVLVLGLAGLVASFGLARNSMWGVPAALVVSGANVVAAILALVTDSEGAVIGLGLSALALVLVFVAGSERRATSQIMPTS